MKSKAKVKTKNKGKVYPGLKPWKKGHSGNPGGRPKGTLSVTSFKTLLDRIGNEVIIDSDFVPLKLKRKFHSDIPITMKEGAMRIVYNMALLGKDWALRFIIDYTEGKPKEFHEVTSKTITIDIDGETSEDLPEGKEIGDNDKKANRSGSTNRR